VGGRSSNVMEARSVTPAEVRKKERRKRVIHPEKTTVERCLLSAILVEAEEGFCVSKLMVDDRM